MLGRHKGNERKHFRVAAHCIGLHPRCSRTSRIFKAEKTYKQVTFLHLIGGECMLMFLFSAFG